MSSNCPSIAVINAPVVKQEQSAFIVESLEKAKSLALPYVSGFYVGAVAVGASGQAYLGFNLEFPGQSISTTIHAEQAALVLAKLHGETRLSSIIASEMPCGHCRQFLMELGDLDLKVIVAKKDSWLEISLKELLPWPFMLSDIKNNPLSSERLDLKLYGCDINNALVETAFKESCLAYAPYTSSFSGAAIRTKDGNIFRGSNIESSSFNPTVPALQAALIHMISCGKQYEDIQETILLEMQNASFSFIEQASCLSRQIAPHAGICASQGLVYPNNTN